MQNVFKFLAKWNTNSDSLAKVQSVYLVLAVALVFIAGLIALVSPAAGQTAAFYALIAALTFVGNGVIWALVKTFAIPYIERHAPKTRKK